MTDNNYLYKCTCGVDPRNVVTRVWESQKRMGEAREGTEGGPEWEATLSPFICPFPPKIPLVFHLLECSRGFLLVSQGRGPKTRDTALWGHHVPSLPFPGAVYLGKEEGTALRHQQKPTRRPQEKKHKVKRCAGVEKKSEILSGPGKGGLRKGAQSGHHYGFGKLGQRWSAQQNGQEWSNVELGQSRSGPSIFQI